MESFRCRSVRERGKRRRGRGNESAGDSRSAGAVGRPWPSPCFSVADWPEAVTATATTTTPIDHPTGRRWGLRLGLTLALAVVHAPTRVAAQNPILNFCRRFAHQTAVVDDRLYIDGGLVDWSPVSSYPSNYSNPYLLYNDLSTVKSGGMPPLYANLSKNASVPSVEGGALWADDVNKWLYLFGGQTYLAPPSPFVLWAYDILNDEWQAAASPSNMQSVSFGAGVSVPSRGEAYYYGGWMSNASIPNWGAGPAVATANLIKYDMDANVLQNYTGPDGIRRAEGVILYIPASDGGMLVAFGGVVDPWGNGSYISQDMSAILLYDVLSSRWYHQTATGDVPQDRRRFCAGVSWPEDQSSYNIYLYGGASVGLGPGFDDVYILSIPSFIWIKMFPTGSNTTSTYQHYSSSCNVVKSAQMVIIGGTFPQTNECDAPDLWGEHNLDLGKQNNLDTPWFMFQPNKTSYAVPDNVFSVIGGGPTGDAIVVSPQAGFGHPDLKVLMTRKASVAQRTPTRQVSPIASTGSDSSLSTGAIVGIAVGGGALLVAVLVGCCCVLGRVRRRQRQQQPQFEQLQQLQFEQLQQLQFEQLQQPPRRPLPPGSQASMSSTAGDHSFSHSPGRFVFAQPPPSPHQHIHSPGPYELNAGVYQEMGGGVERTKTWGSPMTGSSMPASPATPIRDGVTPSSAYEHDDQQEQPYDVFSRTLAHYTPQERG